MCSWRLRRRFYLFSFSRVFPRISSCRTTVSTWVINQHWIASSSFLVLVHLMCRALWCTIGNAVRLDCRQWFDLEFSAWREQCWPSNGKVTFSTSRERVWERRRDKTSTDLSGIDILRRRVYFHRIRTEIEGGAWCPNKPIGAKSNEYIQIELHRLFYIRAVETQGRFDNGQGNEYAEFYQIQYQRENHPSQWLTYYNKQSNKTVGIRHRCSPESCQKDSLV